MQAITVINQLKSIGIALSIHGESIRATPKAAITNDARELIRINKPELIDYLNQSSYTLWFYKIDGQCGFTRMGLMTASADEAQQQLETIYSKPITGLQRRQ